MKLICSLFITFLKIGAFTFGGGETRAPGVGDEEVEHRLGTRGQRQQHDPESAGRFVGVHGGLMLKGGGDHCQPAGAAPWRSRSRSSMAALAVSSRV